MKETKITVLDVEVSYSIPESAEEFDQLAKKTDACLEAAIKNELFHGAYADIRKSIADKLVEAGYERKALATAEKVTGTDDDGNEITETVVTKWETEGNFFKRVCAETDQEPSAFLDLVQSAADANPFDPSKKERTAAPKKVAKTHLEAATAIAADGALEQVAEALAGKLSITIDVSMGGDEAIENLGRAIAMNESAEKKALADKYKNL